MPAFRFRAFLRISFLLGIPGLFLNTPLHAGLLVQNGQKVAFLGDSITDFGWTQPGGYVKLVTSGLQTLGVKIVPIPAGVPGNTSRDMVARLNASVLSKQPDWMTLSCGVNDVWKTGGAGVPLDAYKQNITAMVDQAQAKGIKVVIFTATVIFEQLGGNPNNAKAVAYNDFLRQLAKERNLPLADLNVAIVDAIKAATGTGRHFTVDGIHMNPYGNRIMAEGVLRAFGATDSQIATVKQAWDQDPNGVAFTARTFIDASAPVSLHSYEDFTHIAQERKLKPDQVQASLLLKAWGKAIQAHASDAVIIPAKLQPEVEAEFSRQVNAFFAAPDPQSSGQASAPVAAVR